MAISAEDALRAIRRCYPSLLKLLPISGLVVRFYSLNLLCDNQKSELDSFTKPKDKIQHFLDEILIPGLDIGYTKHFNEMVIMMRDSRNVLSKRLVEKLMEDVSTGDSTDTSPLTSPTRTGIK